MENSLDEVLGYYGLTPSAYSISRIGSGHINYTYKLDGPFSFILQRINTEVFRRPDVIESNNRFAARYLKENHPDYFFITPVPSLQGAGLVYDRQGLPWRLYPYIPSSITLNSAESTTQAFQAAAAFGRLGKCLRGCPTEEFLPTIQQFHDLGLRYEQLKEAMASASPERKKEASEAIELATKNSFLVDRYKKLIGEGALQPGVFHNDTKINNVLFDSQTMNTLAVIDLDTLMPGYFIYDLGDLLRTVVCPVSEEEKDLEKIVLRKDFYRAVMEGYLSEMELSPEEKPQASFAGLMMTYIMAIRFLADYLRGDTYYHTTYPDQNLVRAKNQLRLLELLLNYDFS
jgi:Ser/Thr protein kinase RdoA (MazF antagonist)